MAKTLPQERSQAETIDTRTRAGIDEGVRAANLHAAQAQRVSENAREDVVYLLVVIRLHIDHEGVVGHAQEASKWQIIRAEHGDGDAALEDCAVHAHCVLCLPRRADAEH